MATYKKRGGKSKMPQQQAPEQESVTAEVFSTLDTSAGRAEAWVSRNQNYILSFIALVTVGVFGYLGYENYVVKPMQEESTNLMAHAQSHFSEALEDPTLQDSLFVLALEGDGVNPGFIEIINSYGSSAAAEIATYNAGMIYLKRGEYDKAIDYLEDFSSNDPVLGALALGGIADAFAELNQLDDALGYYQKAANYADNDLTKPRFLLKGAQMALSLGAKADAASMLETLASEYAETPQATHAEVLLAQAQN
jgi:tetratricopeptide (TPR) repeat protein